MTGALREKPTTNEPSPPAFSIGKLGAHSRSGSQCPFGGGSERPSKTVHSIHFSSQTSTRRHSRTFARLTRSGSRVVDVVALEALDRANGDPLSSLTFFWESRVPCRRARFVLGLRRATLTMSAR